jgi:hypothetical protein
LTKNPIKKILVVAESIDVEDSSGTKGRVALIKNLHKAGFELIVYHYSHKEIQLSGIPCVAIKENRRSLLFLLSRLERQIRYKTGCKLNKYVEQFFGFSFTLLNDRNSILAGLKKIRYIKPDLVLTLSKGGSFRPHHALLKIPAWHSKWMAYIHDPYPFACYPRPYDWVEPGHSEKRNFMMAVAKKANYIAYPSKLLAEWMESYYKSLKGKAVIIPHQIQEFGEEQQENMPEFFDPDKFNILHAGSLLWGRNPMGLINGFLKFLNNHPEAKADARLIMISGKNYYSKELGKLSEKYPEIFFSKVALSFKKTLMLQGKTAVNVILEAKAPVSPFLPGKFPHCVISGKPILLLGPPFSESRRLLGEGYRYHAEIDEIHKIADIIGNLYGNWKKNPDVQMNWGDLRNYLSASNLANTLKTKL